MNHNLTFGANTPVTQERLGEMVLYIAGKTRDIDDFGAIKINKTIVFADLEAFRTLGKSITGAQHHRIRMGPVPKHILVAERKLIEDGALEVEQTSSGHKRRAKRSHKGDMFTPDELALVDIQIERLKEMTGNAVSELSHNVAWSVLQDQDLMPYEFAFLDGTVTEKDRSDARSLAEDLGW